MELNRQDSITSEEELIDFVLLLKIMVMTFKENNILYKWGM